MAIVPQLIYRFNVIHIKISADFFAEINTLNLKFIWKCKGPKRVNIILKKNKIGGLKIFNFILTIKLQLLR